MYNWKIENGNEQLVLSVKEFLAFYDYYLSEHKATETKDNKMARDER